MSQSSAVGRREKLAPTRVMDKPGQTGAPIGDSKMQGEGLRAAGARLAAMKPAPRWVGNAVLTRHIDMGKKGSRRIPDAEMPVSPARPKPADETLVMFMVDGQVMTSTELLNSITSAAMCSPRSVKKHYDRALEIVTSASLPDTKLIQQLNARYKEALVLAKPEAILQLDRLTTAIKQSHGNLNALISRYQEASLLAALYADNPTNSTQELDRVAMGALQRIMDTDDLRIDQATYGGGYYVGNDEGSYATAMETFPEMSQSMRCQLTQIIGTLSQWRKSKG